jgi:hypothetical protein
MRIQLLASLVLCHLILFSLTARAAEPEILLDDPFVKVSRLSGLEACAFPATGYHGLELNGATARVVLDDASAEAGSRRVLGKGVKRISWVPSADGLAVEIEFATEPELYAVNAMSTTELKPGVPQVIAAFSFPADSSRSSYPVMGAGAKTGSNERGDEHGTYELPKFPPVKYSDARVTLNVRNTDFRDVLWLLSDIGGVSIMLDPYWDQEPTGGTRPPGGGANGDGGGDGGPGFRPGGEFDPPVPRDGTGNLTLNFIDVPFDTALDLILMSVGLVKTDIYPGDKL